MSSADGDGSSSSTSTGSATSGPTGDDTTGDSTSTTGATLGTSSTSAQDTTAGSSSSSGSETTGGSSSDSSSDSSSSGETTGGAAEACEDGGQLVLSWGLQVPGGVYPDDIPTDLDATCAFSPSATPGELPLACGKGLDLLVTVESDPPVVLPAEGQPVEVRVHRQPGPLGFPDFWVELTFEEGRRFSFVSSSVLVPNNETVELPFDMALSAADCGPFNIGTPFEPEDPCGDQMWLGLDLSLDDPLTVFHGTYGSGMSGGDEVGVWVGTARDYGVLPKFCDIAPAFFTTMVVSG